MRQRGAREDGERRRRNSVAPNPWRRGRRRLQPRDPNSSVQDFRDTERGGPMFAALFDDVGRAARAHATLVARGYRREDIVVVMAQAVWDQIFGAGSTDQAANGFEARLADFRADMAAGSARRRVGSVSPAARALAAGRFAEIFTDAARPDSEDALRQALIECGVPAGRSTQCAAAVTAGRILLGVVPHDAADAQMFGQEWPTSSRDADTDTER
jgi:hypothetical protein